MTKKRKTNKVGNLQGPRDMWKRAKFPQPEEIPQEDAEEVAALFNKNFCYSGTQKIRGKHAQLGETTETDVPNSTKQWHSKLEDWVGVTPHMTQAGLEADPELMTLKAEVNKVKNQLSCKEIQTWHAHTTRCNLAANIIPHVKSLDVELCTQAWVKFYEILSGYHQRGLLLDRSFLSLHLCEAPGAFVTALNHFLQQQGFPHMWDWRATTLNPYHESNNLGEMIADDRLIRQTYTQWFFGEDGSGDITLPGHTAGLCRLMSKVSEEQELEVLLVTADGSKDCQVNPAEQESLVSRLHYCEALTACLTLASGGALVLKVFTLYERSSVLLVFLLNLMFDEVHAVKPATSKSGNSEVYLVCLSYRKNVEKQTLWRLLDVTVYHNTKEEALSLSQPLPSNFMEEHRLLCKTFAQWQLETIRSNLELYQHMSADQAQRLSGKQRLALSVFLQKSCLESRGRHCRRVSGFFRDKSAFYFPPLPPGVHHLTHHHKQPPAQQQQHRLTGTFELRQNLGSMPWADRLRMIEYKDDSEPRLTHMQCRYPPEDSELDEWTEVDTGQAFSVIRTSRLCDVSLLSDFNLMLENSDYERCRQWKYMEHASWLGLTAAQLLLTEIDTMFGPFPQVPLSSSCLSVQQQKFRPIFYWDRGRGEAEEKNSPLYESFLHNIPDRENVTVVDEESDHLSKMLATGDTALLFCNVTSFCDTHFQCSWNSVYEELMCRAKFTQRVAAILNNLSQGSSLVLLTPTFLTRLTSSLLYILTRSFCSVKIESTPNLWLHQLVRLEDYRSTGPGLLSHLLDTGQQLGLEARDRRGQGCVMEAVSFPSVISDRKFVQLVTAHNNRSLGGFLNMMLDHARKLTTTGPVQEGDSG